MSALERRNKVPIVPGPWREVGVALAAVLVLAMVVYFGPLFFADQQHGLSPVQHINAVNDARASLAAVVTAVGLAGGLLFTAFTFALSKKGQNTDRYQAGIKQLGDASMTVRIGGIYALEKLAQDVAWTRQTISDVLESFVSCSAKVGDQPISADIQAALTVLGRRTHSTPLRPLNLSGLSLIGANLQGAQLRHARLERTNLRKADLTDACLQGAAMQDARLLGANLSNSNFRNADLTGVDLSNATLYQADFAKATLTDWRVDGCDLTSAHNLPQRAISASRRANAGNLPDHA